jgi:hypothetical protein
MAGNPVTKRPEDKLPENMEPVDTKAVENDPRFNFGPPKIQTPEDATYAYMKGEITEDELRAAHAKFGVVPGSVQQIGNVERIDAAFENRLPDDLYTPTKNPDDNIEARLKKADEKQKERDEATKEAKKQPTLVGGTAYAEAETDTSNKESDKK